MFFEIKELEPQIAANIALVHELYVPGWSFRPYFSSVSEEKASPARIFLAFNSHNHPVGVSVYDPRYRLCGFDSGVFVAPLYRRHGIGKALIKEAAKAKGARLELGYGIEGSSTFFKKALGYN